MAGDTLEIRDGQVYINGKPGETPPGLQTTYFMQVDSPNDEVREALRAQGVVDYDQPGGYPAGPAPTAGRYGYVISCTQATADYFSKQPYVKSITGAAARACRCFPTRPTSATRAPASAVQRNWKLDNYGPLPIPKKGQTLPSRPATPPSTLKSLPATSTTRA